jgi:membrane protease subunit HflK
MSPPDSYGRRPTVSFNRDDIPWDEISMWISRVLLTALAVGVVLAVVSMFYRIDASDEGVVLRFGKKVETAMPGLHWKLPWPIDKVYKVPVQRIQILEFGFATRSSARKTLSGQTSREDLGVAEMLTGDLNLGHVDWIVQYRVKDSGNYLFKIGGANVVAPWPLVSGEDYEANPAVPDTIRDISESVMRKLVGDSSIDYVLTIGRDQIAKDAEMMLQQELDGFQAGVDIVTVKLQTTSPPTLKVQDAFQEVNRARQKKERVVNEAQGERNSKIPAARGARDKAIAEAEGYHNRVVLETTGAVNAFLAQLAEYEKAREVTRKRLYLEAMEEILATVGSKTIIDESVRGVVPLLNLNQGVETPAVKEVR